MKGIFSGKRTLVFGVFANLSVKSFNNIGCVNDTSEFFWIFEVLRNIFPIIVPGLQQFHKQCSINDDTVSPKRLWKSGLRFEVSTIYRVFWSLLRWKLISSIYLTSGLRNGWWGIGASGIPNKVGWTLGLRSSKKSWGILMFIRNCLVWSKMARISQALNKLWSNFNSGKYLESMAKALLMTNRLIGFRLRHNCSFPMAASLTRLEACWKGAPILATNMMRISKLRWRTMKS